MLGVGRAPAPHNLSLVGDRRLSRGKSVFFRIFGEFSERGRRISERGVLEAKWVGTATYREFRWVGENPGI